MAVEELQEEIQSLKKTLAQRDEEIARLNKKIDDLEAGKVTLNFF
jgi:peptidoglycan hydrolase CwlO-like protein